MFFAYQREQAEANTQHEMMMAQIVLQQHRMCGHNMPTVTCLHLPNLCQQLARSVVGIMLIWPLVVSHRTKDPFIVICDHVKNSSCFMQSLVFDLLILKQVMFQCLR